MACHINVSGCSRSLKASVLTMNGIAFITLYAILNVSSLNGYDINLQYYFLQNPSARATASSIRVLGHAEVPLRRMNEIAVRHSRNVSCIFLEWKEQDMLVWVLWRIWNISFSTYIYIIHIFCFKHIYFTIIGKSYRNYFTPLVGLAWKTHF